MPQLHITLDTGNDAFVDNPVPEAQRIIHEALAKSLNLEDLDGTKLYDANGNAVGFITLTDSKTSEEETPAAVRKPVEIFNPPNPICYLGGKWWFWDETWTETIGPYSSEALAGEALTTYCLDHLGFGSNSHTQGVHHGR